MASASASVPVSQIAGEILTELPSCRVAELPSCRVAELPSCRKARFCCTLICPMARYAANDESENARASFIRSPVAQSVGFALARGADHFPIPCRSAEPNVFALRLDSERVSSKSPSLVLFHAPATRRAAGPHPRQLMAFARELQIPPLQLGTSTPTSLRSRPFGLPQD